MSDIDPEFWQEDRLKDLPRPPRQPMSDTARKWVGGVLLTTTFFATGFLIDRPDHRQTRHPVHATAPRSTTTTLPKVQALPELPNHLWDESIGITSLNWDRMQGMGWEFYGNLPAEGQDQLDTVGQELSSLRLQYGWHGVQTGPMYDEQTQKPMTGDEISAYHHAHPSSPTEVGAYYRPGIAT